MKKLLVFAACALAAFASFATAAKFAKKMDITVSAGAVATGTTLTDFPALVRLSTGISGFSYSDFRQSGEDMMFVDSSGAVLPHEIDTWNVGGTSFVWVKVPSLSVTPISDNRCLVGIRRRVASRRGDRSSGRLDWPFPVGVSHGRKSLPHHAGFRSRRQRDIPRGRRGQFHLP